MTLSPKTLLLASILAASISHAQDAPAPAITPGPTLSYLDQLKLRGQGVMQTSQDVSSEVYRKLRQDVGNMSRWEYRLLTLETAAPAPEIEQQLNLLGRDRWELVSVTPAKKRTVLWFKRPRKSYLQSLPLKELLNLFQGGGGG